MNGFRPEERKQMQQIHGLSSGAESIPSSRRDASRPTEQSQSKVWSSAKATIIQTPSNDTSRRNYRGTNPFNGRFASTLHTGNRGPSAGNNRTASATVLSNFTSSNAQSPSRSVKRPRVVGPKDGRDASKPYAESSVSRFFSDKNGTHPRVSQGQSVPNSEVAGRYEQIVIDGDEDIGTPVERPFPAGPSSKRNAGYTSPDPLNIIDSPSGTHSSKPHDFELSSDSIQSTRGLPPDGDARKRLQERVHQAKVIDVDEPDPIEDFSDSEMLPSASGPATPHGTVLPANNVQKKKAIFEMAPTPVLHIDLRTISGKPQSKKSSMKPRAKKEDAGKLLDPIATSSSGFKSTTLTKKSATKAKKPDQPPEPLVLPLQEWSLGCRLMQDEDRAAVEPRYWLTYTQDFRPLLTVRERSGHNPLNGQRLEEFNVSDGITSFTHTQWPCLVSMPVILQVKPSRPTQIDPRFPEYNPGSRGLDGTVTFRFMTTHANWRNGEVYEKLIRKLQDSIPKVEYLDPSGSRACWEKTLGAAELKKAELRQEVSSSSRGDDGPKVSTSNKPASRPSPRFAYKAGPATSERETRSTRQSARSSAPRSPTPEPDELILVYPPTGAGAININKSDLKRLEPNAYLNDTLIEFGLKLWLAELKEKEPEIAEQVHVFNSFFYKKLNVKDKEGGYQSVRKWTSKFDLFEKKYIIVPINENFHWYLAIIYHPQHTLTPAPVTRQIIKPNTRKRKRESGLSDLAETEDLEEITVLQPRSTDQEVIPDSCPPSRAPSPHLSRQDSDEEQVEKLLDSTQACSINDKLQISDHMAVVDEKPAVGEPVGAESMDIDTMHLQYPSSPIKSPERMEVDSPLSLLDDADEARCSENSAAQSASNASALSLDDGADVRASVVPSLFYGASSASRLKKGKEKATAASVDLDEAQPEEILASESSEPHRTTYIFIFDSLGSRHPQAIKTLTRYLQMEAKDKKGIGSPGLAQGRHALVPIQPNWCDCGLYVLHFVRVFLRSPDSYQELILSTKQKGYLVNHRKQDWKDDEVGKLRDELKQRIKELSLLWKNERTAKEQQQKKDEAQQSSEKSKVGAVASTVSSVSSDEEVVIADVEVTSAAPSKSKSTDRAPRKK